jgi:hypothetical protein
MSGRGEGGERVRDLQVVTRRVRSEVPRHVTPGIQFERADHKSTLDSRLDETGSTCVEFGLVLSIGVSFLYEERQELSLFSNDGSARES